MAFIILDTGRAVTLPHERAVRLKNVLDGKEQGTPEQLKFAGHVRKIYFGKQFQPIGMEREQVLPWWHR